MPRRITIQPEPVQDIHGVRLVLVGALHLLMLTTGGLGAQLAYAIGKTTLAHVCLTSAAALATIAIALIAPILWKARPHDRALALLTLLFPITFLLTVFITL